MKKMLFTIASHLFVGLVGFAAGIYALPILTAPEAPSAEQVMADVGGAEFEGEFRRDLQDSDFLHWGEGTVLVSHKAISLVGRIAPGPDYGLYLSREFVETEDDFERLQGEMARVGDVKTFTNFSVAVPAGLDPARYNTVIVWCESFGEFITSARYQ